MSQKHDFGYRLIPAHQHENGGGWVADTAHVDSTAYIGPFARVYGKARVYGEARVGQTTDVLTIGPIGSRSAILTILFRPTLCVATGCFFGSIANFEAAITKTHGDNPHGREYRAAIAYIRQIAEFRQEARP